MTAISRNNKTAFSYVILVWLLLLLLSSCRQSPEPGEGGPIRLTAYDAGVTDVWLRLQVSAAAPYTLSITRDGKEIFSSSKSLTDTLVLDTGLLPKHAYTYRGYVRGANILESDSSAPLTLTTMDTTSHGIQWTLDTLGDGASSMLNDVFILNDTCAFAVGAVYFRDSLGNFDGIPYNFLKWDGKKWELRKASVLFRGHMITVPLNGVYAFSEHDIWISGGLPIHGDGNSWQIYPIEDMGLPSAVADKPWGRSSSDIYFAGRGGTVVHYDGTHWTQLQTGTTMEIQDIYGAQNKTTGRWEILATAGNYYVSNERKILSITDTTITALSDSGINWALSSVWFVPGKEYWVVGDGVYKKNFALQLSLWQRLAGSAQYGSTKVRGTQINDIFICGSFGEIVHFNGASWHNYFNQIKPLYGIFYSIASKGDLIIAVGEINPLAIIAVGRRMASFEREEVK
jgi:hypothetical protein